ncbi:MAG: molybdopterin cofactor-binding domain-containing protein [Caldilineaceae bacterium]
MTAAHDAGRIINPTLFEGQIEGSIHMGLGYAISEELPYEGGRPKSTMLRKCGILRAKEMPEMEVIGIEVPDPHGAYGLKGVGELVWCRRRERWPMRSISLIERGGTCCR